MAALFLLVAAVPEGVAVALLAVLQGLTEFLPISSSGHLVLAQTALGFSQPGLVIDVALHLGTLVAVLVVYRADVQRLLRGLLAGSWTEPLLLVLATVPAVIVALVAGDAVERAFTDPVFAARGLLGTAVILAIGEVARRRRGPVVDPPGEVGRPGWGGALAMGCAQALAILPGVSRSGSTIAAGLVLGLSPTAAARFSFLMAIPAILGAAVHELPKMAHEEVGVGVTTILAGVVIAAVVGWFALRLLLAFLGRGAFLWFALYCALLGAAYLALA